MDQLLSDTEGLNEYKNTIHSQFNYCCKLLSFETQSGNIIAQLPGIRDDYLIVLLSDTLYQSRAGGNGGCGGVGYEGSMTT